MKNNVAIILMRGGSKRLIKKNVKILKNKPLCAWVIQSAIDSKLFDDVYVVTDDLEISNISESYGAKIFIRSAESSTDFASPHIAICEFLKVYTNVKTITLLQATSPLTTPEDLSNALKYFYESSCDSLITVTNLHLFRYDEKGNPLSYDANNKPRHQDWTGEYFENGSFYIFDVNKYLKNKILPLQNNRIYVMKNKFIVDIDTMEDFKFAEYLISQGYGYQPKQSKHVAIDIGGTYVRSCIIYNDNIICYTEFQTHLIEDKYNYIINEIENKLLYAQENNLCIEGIGISSGGIIKDNEIFDSKNISNYKNVKFEKFYKKIPIFVENDGICNLLGEIKFNGICTHSKNIMALKFGTGVSVGIIINGIILKNTEGGLIFEKIFKDNISIDKLTCFSKKIIELIELMNLDFIFINGYLINDEYISIIQNKIDLNIRDFYKKCKIIYSKYKNTNLYGAILLNQ